MKKHYFYIILACFVIAAFGFSYAAQLRMDSIASQACPNDNCETIIKEYEYLPVPVLEPEEEVSTENAMIVDSITALSGEDVETDENSIYNHNVFAIGLDVTTKQLNVNGALFAAGKNVKATTRQQTLFAAGETVYVNSTTSQDAYVAGMNVDFTEDSSVRDLFTAGQTIRLSGTVKGSVFAAGEKIIVEDATILGDANFDSSSVEFKGDNYIHGTLRYDNDTRIMNLDQSKVGGIASYVVPNASNDIIYNIFTFASTACSIVPTVALFAVFVISLSKKQYERLAANKSAAKDAGIGFLALLIIPCVLLLLLSFEILSLINIFLILALVIALILSVAIATIRVGNFVNNNILKAKNVNHYQIVLLGAVTFGLLWVVPVIGRAIDLVLLIAGFGYIIGELIHASTLKNKAKKALTTEK